jgi:hypothetical protein
MWRAVMLRDVIGAKAGKVTSDRDVQAFSILLPQAAARVVQMIENTKAYCRLTITLHEPLRRWIASRGAKSRPVKAAAAIAAFPKT